MAFESGNIVKNLQTVYGEVQAYDPSLNPAGGPVGKDGPPGARQGETVEIPPGFTGEVLRSDDLTTIAIYPIHSTGKLEPMLIKVEDFTVNFKRVVRHNPFIWDKQRDLKDPGRPIAKQAALEVKESPMGYGKLKRMHFYDDGKLIAHLSFRPNKETGGTYVEWLGAEVKYDYNENTANPLPLSGRQLLQILRWMKDNLPAPFTAEFWNKKLMDTVMKVAPGLIAPDSTFAVDYSEMNEAGDPLPHTLDEYPKYKDREKFIYGSLKEAALTVKQTPRSFHGLIDVYFYDENDDIVATMSYMPEEQSGGTYINWLGGPADPNTDEDDVYLPVGGRNLLEILRWIKTNLPAPYRANFWNKKLLETIQKVAPDLLDSRSVFNTGEDGVHPIKDLPKFKNLDRFVLGSNPAFDAWDSYEPGKDAFEQFLLNPAIDFIDVKYRPRTKHDPLIWIYDFTSNRFIVGDRDVAGIHGRVMRTWEEQQGIDRKLPFGDAYFNTDPNIQTARGELVFQGDSVAVTVYANEYWDHKEILEETKMGLAQQMAGFLTQAGFNVTKVIDGYPYWGTMEDNSVIAKFAAALINPDDPLDEPGLQEVINAQEVPWWTYPRDQREQAVANSLRVGILSPLKLLKFNAVHYQDIAHIPAEETDINVYLEALGQRREKWNQRGQVDIFTDPSEVSPFDPKNNEAYAGYIHKHLQYIVNISQHIKELTDAAEQDVMEGGEGFIWREALMKLKLPGANSKVSSFAWLLLAPKTSQLATIDTHMLRALGADERMAANPEGYAHLENELKAGRDALGYQHMPLGQFQWGLWDYVRTPPDETGYHHQNHGAMKVLDPTPYDQIDWHVPPSARGERPLPDWWLKTRDARDPLRMEWELKRKRPVKPQTPVEDDAALKLFAALDKFAGVKESHWLDGYVAAILDPALEEMEIAEDESQFHRHINESMTYDSHWRGLYNPQTKDLLHMSTNKKDIYAGEMSSLSNVKPYFDQIKNKWLSAAAKNLDVSGSSTFGAFVVDDTMEHELIRSWPGNRFIDPNTDMDWGMTHVESLMNSMNNPSLEGTPYLIYRGEQQQPQPVDEKAADDFMKTWTDYFGITAKWEKVGHWLQGYYGAVVTKSGGEMKVAPDPYMFHQYIETNIALRGIYNPDTRDLLHMSVGWDTEMDELDLDITVQPELYELKEEWLAAAGFSGYEVRTFGALVADSGFNPDDFPLGDFGVFEQENATVDNLPEGHKIIRG